MGVSLTFVGCGDAFGSGGRSNTCFRFDGDKQTALIDCGPTTLPAMKKFGQAPNDIDAIILSHLHGDHFGGLPFFLLEARYVSKRTKPLLIAGPEGTEARIEAACEVLFPGSFAKGFAFPLKFIEMDFGKSWTVGDFTVTPYRADHPSGDPSQILRVETAEKTVVYSGDTQWTDDLVTASAGADLFVCECFMDKAGVPFHLTHEILLAHRDQFTAKRMILTHMSEEMLAAADTSPFETAFDGLTVTL